MKKDGKKTFSWNKFELVKFVCFHLYIMCMGNPFYYAHICICIAYIVFSRTAHIKFDCLCFHSYFIFARISGVVCANYQQPYSFQVTAFYFFFFRQWRWSVYVNRFTSHIEKFSCICIAKFSMLIIKQKINNKNNNKWEKNIFCFSYSSLCSIHIIARDTTMIIFKTIIWKYCKWKTFYVYMLCADKYQIITKAIAQLLNRPF